MNIHFLYGTETGTSEMLCEDIRDDLDLQCEITSMGDFDASTLDGDTFYIFVTSTYGTGDLPMTAQPFYDAIASNKPDLSHVNFAVFGLGDMVFADTFAFGSKILMELLVDRGAKMVGERGIHDASSADMPEDIAVPWAAGILDIHRAAAA